MSQNKFVILFFAMTTFVSVITGGLGIAGGVFGFIILWIMWNMDKRD